MSKLLSSAMIFLILSVGFFVLAGHAFAQDGGPIIVGPEIDDPTTSIFGTITPPKGTEQYSVNNEIGLLTFISMLVRISTVVAGIIVFFNFILSGYTYVTSDGNPKAAETVRNRLTYSIIGLVLIVSAYVITALISLIIFGDASYILNPTITPPGVVTPVP